MEHKIAIVGSPADVVLQNMILKNGLENKVEVVQMEQASERLSERFEIKARPELKCIDYEYVGSKKSKAVHHNKKQWKRKKPGKKTHRKK